MVDGAVQVEIGHPWPMVRWHHFGSSHGGRGFVVVTCIFASPSAVPWWARDGLRWMFPPGGSRLCAGHDQSQRSGHGRDCSWPIRFWPSSFHHFWPNPILANHLCGPIDLLFFPSMIISCPNRCSIHLQVKKDNLSFFVIETHWIISNVHKDEKIENDFRFFM